MADRTKIEWTSTRNADGTVTPGATWNPITGCSVVSAGCKHCYAMKLAGTRLRSHPSREGLTVDTKAGPVWNGAVRFNEKWLHQPMSWRRARFVFVCAHGDLFHENVPDEWIDKVFAVMALSPNHTFQVLTKRPQRMLEYLRGVTLERIADRFGCPPEGLFNINNHELRVRLTGKPEGARRHYEGKLVEQWPLPNVWLGTSVEDQAAANERIPFLLQCPAAVRWLSCEPLLGPLDLTLDGLVCRPCPNMPEFPIMDPTTGAFECCSDCDYTGVGSEWGIDWVVVGGESGVNARPMQRDWARALRDQCKAASVPFFFKQWGEFAPNWLNDDDGKEIPGSMWVDRMGKRAAGRLLDGVEYSEFPA